LISEGAAGWSLDSDGGRARALEGYGCIEQALGPLALHLELTTSTIVVWRTSKLATTFTSDADVASAR